MMLVVLEFEILKFVVENRIRLAFDHQLRQCKRLTFQLGFDLFQMVRIDVHISSGPNELAHFQVALLSDHMG
ncbi:hypothetical protein D1872_341430 [compost metagenome]